MMAPTSPTAMTLNSPASSPGNDDTPTLDVDGVTIGDTVYIYTDASCSTQVGSVEATPLNQ